MKKIYSGEPIDFVIIWVDGNDPEWQKEMKLYKSDANTDNSVRRFRDWDNLQYWFRAVEYFTPWVNKIHFVTWGHLPEWLNTSHPKLNIVNHSDYIPAEYLPTFSANPIELNLHRIKGLSERFVYFNDDMFIIKKMKPEDFFVGNLPCDSGVLNVHCYNIDEMFIMSPIRDVGIINRYFNMKNVLKQKPLNWFNLKYGVNFLRNLYLLPCPRFPGFYQQHLPASYCKKTLEEVWEKEFEIMDITCRHKFRDVSDVNQWVFKEWQLAKNEFYPRKLSIGKSFALYTADDAYKYISEQKGHMVCLNDVDMTDTEFEKRKEKIKEAFHIILPDKSLYEK